jgi:hypothetical protein
MFFEDSFLLRCDVTQSGEYVFSCEHGRMVFLRNVLPYQVTRIRVIKPRSLRWAGHVARIGEMRGAYRALVGKLEERRQFERPSRRWEDNIKMDIREVG